MGINLASQLEDNAANVPHKAAFIYQQPAGIWKTITYLEILGMEKGFERGLLNLGVSQRTRAVLMAPPGIQFFALAFALLKTGVTVVMIDPAIGLKNVTTCLDEARADVFIGNSLTHTLRMLYGWGKKSIVQNLTPNQIFQAGYMPLKKPSTPIKTNSDAAVIYTSGSTGLPKGAIYTHENLKAQMEMLVNALELDGNEIDLPAFPIFALIDLLLGITAVIPDLRFPRPARVDPRRISAAIQKYQVGTLFASPVVLDRIARYGRKNAVLLPSLKKVITAGAPAPVSVLEDFQKMVMHHTGIFAIYGATEALPITLINCQEVLDETRFATEKGAGICVGKAVQGMQVQIMPITDSVVPAWNGSLETPINTVGEIVVAGPAVTSAYVGKADDTRLAKMTNSPNGILHRMGDLGWLDEQSRLWYCGRKSQRVETPHGVYFTEAVEGILNTHPQVYRTALVGVKQQGLVVPVLWVELKPQVNAHQIETIKGELLEMGTQREMTRQIKIILFQKSFPTDVRHNSKIIREKLALTAQERLK